MPTSCPVPLPEMMVQVSWAGAVWVLGSIFEVDGALGDDLGEGAGAAQRLRHVENGGAVEREHSGVRRVRGPKQGGILVPVDAWTIQRRDVVVFQPAVGTGAGQRLVAEVCGRVDEVRVGAHRPDSS